MLETRSVTVRKIPDVLQSGQPDYLPERVGTQACAALIETVQRGNALTVGETDGFVASGVVNELSVDENRIGI